jgi:lipopolysaccharide transport system permease protein
MSTELDIVGTMTAPAKPGAKEAEPVVTVIEPVRGWQPINFRELWAFRELIYFLTWRDVKVRYKQTALGMAWAILQPALLMVVFMIITTQVARVTDVGVPQVLFVYLGVLPWTFFANAITNAGNSVVGSERLVAKVYFPRLSIPIASAGAATVDLLIACSLLAVLMVYYSVVPGTGIVLAPIVFAILALTALGVGTMLAALNVLYRDFKYVIPFMVQIWMLGTPAIYFPPEQMGSKLLIAHYWNPISGLIGAFRNACLNKPVDMGHLALSGLVAVALFLCGCWYFRRLERRFADVI